MGRCTGGKPAGSSRHTFTLTHTHKQTIPPAGVGALLSVQLSFDLYLCQHVSVHVCVREIPNLSVHPCACVRMKTHPAGATQLRVLGVEMGNKQVCSWNDTLLKY